jgi:hypothetical protein
MIKFRLFVLLLSVCFAGFSQNTIRFLAADGHLFTVKLKGTLVNPQPQSSVLTAPIKEDSVNVSIEFENGVEFQTPIYLLDKGKPCATKEFNYRLEIAEKKVKLIFLGIYEMTSLPDPLVPIKPIKDTMPAYRNRFMATCAN